MEILNSSRRDILNAAIEGAKAMQAIQNTPNTVNSSLDPATLKMIAEIIANQTAKAINNFTNLVQNKSAEIVYNITNLTLNQSEIVVNNVTTNLTPAEKQSRVVLTILRILAFFVSLAAGYAFFKNYNIIVYLINCIPGSSYI